MFKRWFSPEKIVLSNGKIVEVKRSLTPIIVLVICVGAYFSAQFTNFDLKIFFSRIDEFFKIVFAMVPPDWETLHRVWSPLFDTIKMSILGSLLGALVALPIAIGASSNVINNKLIVVVCKFILSLLRTLPTLVTALIATFIFGLGTLAGTAAIFLFTISYVGKLLYEQIENADMGSFEAMQSLGLTRIQSFRYAILPQVLPSYISTSLYCFEGNVRYAAILGYVGAGGIGLLINEGLGWRDYPAVGLLILVLIVTVYLIESISEHFRKKLI